MRKLLKKILPNLLTEKIIQTLFKIRCRKLKDDIGNIGGYHSYAISKKHIRNDTVIGKFCSISVNVHIAPAHHPTKWLSSSPVFYNSRVKDLHHEELGRKIHKFNASQKVIIGNDVWIGVNAMILQGVTIGDGAIIDANAIVTKDIPPYAIAGGVPAKVLNYRFDESTIEELLKYKWWNKPENILKKLPVDDVQESIKILKQYDTLMKTQMKICFIITSVVYPSEEKLSYTDIRSVYTAKERYAQTIETIESIRSKCEHAHIVLVDAGIENPAFENYVDEFYYIGDIPEIRSSVDSPNKSLGEAKMLLHIIDKIGSFDFIFKLSGRYWLNDEFDLTNFDFNLFNFKICVKCIAKQPHGESKYIKGAHSTRLYGIPGKHKDNYKCALQKTIKYLKHGESIENALPYCLRKHTFYYQETLGVSGKCGVVNNLIEE